MLELKIKKTNDDKVSIYSSDDNVQEFEIISAILQLIKITKVNNIKNN